MDRKLGTGYGGRSSAVEYARASAARCGILFP